MVLIDTCYADVTASKAYSSFTRPEGHVGFLHAGGREPANSIGGL
jgi:hypothetical protein